MFVVGRCLAFVWTVGASFVALVVAFFADRRASAGVLGWIPSCSPWAPSSGAGGEVLGTLFAWEQYSSSVGVRGCRLPSMHSLACSPTDTCAWKWHGSG